MGGKRCCGCGKREGLRSLKLLLCRRTSDDIWMHPDAKPFLSISRWLFEADPHDIPRVVILENSDGIWKKSAGSMSSPLDFVMKGELFDHELGHSVTYGLALNPRYLTHVFQLSSTNVGLPHKRGRIFLVMIKKGALAPNVFKQIQENLGTISASFQVECVGNFMGLPPNEVVEEPPPKKKPRAYSLEKVIGMSFVQRRSLGLPPASLYGTESRPFSTQARVEQLQKFTNREKEVADISILRAMKENCGILPPWMVIDVSQSPNRHSFRSGGFHMNTFTTSSHFLVIPGMDIAAAHELSPQQSFQLQGWPVEHLVIPPELNKTDLRTLVGNMISVPAIGAVLASVLAAVNFRPSQDLRPKRPAAP